MKYIKLDLLTLLISLFILSSCEKKGTIGLDIAPQDSIKSILSDAFSINTKTIPEDTVMTSGISQNPFGFLKDAVFGTTEANLALGLSLPSENLTFGNSPTLDSAVLVLKYGKEFYGDSLTADYSINVHQLRTNPYSFSTIYYNNKVWDFEPSIIGSKTVKHFSWNSSPSTFQIIDNKPDTLKKLDPQLRIPIDPAFIATKFFGGAATNFKNNAAFINFIKGLYVTINKSQSTNNGGIVFFDLKTPAVSGLEIYYKNTTGTVKDTNVVVFRLDGASNIKHDYTGTPVQTQLNSTAQTSATVYVQPLGGVRTKIRFPDLANLKANGPVAINKAELVIPVLSADDNPLKPAPRLILYTVDIAGQRKYIPDNAIRVGSRFLDERSFGGFYNSTSKTYTFNITSYIQDLVSKSVIQYDLYISPFDLPLTNSINIDPSASIAARSVLGGGSHPQSPMKLKIIYTKPN